VHFERILYGQRLPVRSSTVTIIGEDLADAVEALR
jgi:hypothetical protein